MTAIDHADRKKLHGILLPAIAQQVALEQPSGPPVFHDDEWWKRALAAGYGIKGSTEDLPGDAYRAFVWWVETQAVSRMGVRIADERRAA